MGIVFVQYKMFLCFIVVVFLVYRIFEKERSYFYYNDFFVSTMGLGRKVIFFEFSALIDL